MEKVNSRTKVDMEYCKKKSVDRNEKICLHILIIDSLLLLLIIFKNILLFIFSFVIIQGVFLSAIEL